MSQKVWECRNLPEIRKWMVNTELIPYNSHAQFVESLKYKKEALYFSVLHEGNFIGSVNIHIGIDGEAERGIYIHPDFWGCKFAKRICSEFYQYLKTQLGIKNIITKVLKGNISSNSLENSLHAKKVREDSEFFYYCCRL